MSDVTLRRRERLRAVLDREATYTMGALIPTPDPTNGGNRRHSPGWVYVVFAAMVHVYGSERQAAVELADPIHWRMVQRAGKCRFPDDPTMHASATPMTRGSYRFVKTRYIALDSTLDAVLDCHETASEADAAHIGVLTGAAGSLTHPDNTNLIYGDGKIVKARYKNPLADPSKIDPETGEIHARHWDREADDFKTGGGTEVYGHNFVHLDARNSNENERLILTVAYAPKKGGEAKVTVELFNRVLPRYLNAQGAVYDMSLRGTHIHEIQCTHGIPAIVKVPKKNGEPDNVRLGNVEWTDATGVTGTLDIHLVNGQPYIKTLNVNGQAILDPLRRIKTTRDLRADNTWRLTNTYAVPATHGGGCLQLRLDQTKEDRKRVTPRSQTAFNREEHLRAIPVGDPDFERVHGIRQDAESHHRKLDDSMTCEWAHSVGRKHQTWDMLMWAHTQNALAVAYHDKRQKLTGATKSAA